MADLKRWSQGEIGRMRRDMDRMFDDFCSDFDLPLMLCRMAGDLELVDENWELVARMALGSMNPDSVKVSVRDRRLVIQAVSVVEDCCSRESRSCTKEIRLPCRIDPDGVKMRFVDGVLEILLPKCRPEKVHRTYLLKR
ncbi:Hsp20/alpha crystallin family protein [Pseudodesulfovibrio sp.]|uniref:Hsp20/alpha crystallin family protein n=1 Tax=unclassified Pseudodesulfovibrio TaxID=2661612 RepID=UPI003B002ED0